MSSRLNVALTLEDIRSARERIADAIVLTPVVPALALRDRVSGPLFLKLENMQRTGTFKDRGALHRLLALTAEERAHGVVTASAGNHAQAVAYHGARLGIPVQVVWTKTRSPPRSTCGSSSRRCWPKAPAPCRSRRSSLASCPLAETT